MENELKLFSGRANPQLSEKISQYLGVKLGEMEISNFSDGEIWVRICENVRGTDCFVIQPTCYPGNQNLMELLIMIDAFKRASVRCITAVLPYFGYARQDRKVQPRVPITAKLVANLISAVGANRVLTMDLHAGQIQGFFDIPVDHLFAAPVLIDYVRHLEFTNLIVVSPDAGGVERARAFAKRLDVSLGIIDKRRERNNVSQVMHIIGEVDGRDVLLVDDMIDTGGTLIESVNALAAKGARRILACCTHGVLSGSAIERLNDSPLEELIVTDTVPVQEKAETCKKLRVLSVALLLGEAIQRIHNETSVSSLFV